jgi:hypothetical protein
MKRMLIAMAAVLAGVLPPFSSSPAEGTKTNEPDWSVNMTVLESCSCPVFCQCFFTGVPPMSGDMNMGDSRKAFCRFNQAYEVNAGHFGSVRLDGVKFWFAGDAGESFARPKLDWAVLTFDSSATEDQRNALSGILHHLHFYQPQRWKSYSIGNSASMDWSYTPDSAKAALDGGKTAEVVLRRLDGGMNSMPVTMNNMDFFGYPRNSGFLLMPDEVEAYRVGEKAFEYHGTNGLVTTVEISSKDVKQ